MRRSRVVPSLTGVIVAGATAALSASPGHPQVRDPVKVPGLRAAASVVRDVEGVPHLKARNGGR